MIILSFSYADEVVPCLIYRMEKPKVVLVIYKFGKVGLRGELQLQESKSNLYN